MALGRLALGLTLLATGLPAWSAPPGSRPELPRTATAAAAAGDKAPGESPGRGSAQPPTAAPPEAALPAATATGAQGATAPRAQGPAATEPQRSGAAAPGASASPQSPANPTRSSAHGTASPSADAPTRLDQGSPPPRAAQPARVAPTAMAASAEPAVNLADWPSLDQLLGLPPWLSLQLQATAAPIANPIGGLRSATSWMQQIELDLSAGTGLGLGKAPGSSGPWRELDHWQADLRLDLYNGNPGYGAAIGSLIAPQTIDYPTGLWLSGASLTRRSQDERLRLSGGLLSLDQDFVVAPAYNAYLFASINNTLNLNILGLPITPFVAPGGSVRWQSGGLGEWRLGAYWLDPEIQLASLLGVDTGLPRLAGNLQMVQWVYPSAAGKARYTAPISGPGGSSIDRQLPPPLLHVGAFRSQVSVSGGNTVLFPQAQPRSGGTALNRVAYGSLTLPLRLPLGLDNRVWAAAQLGFDPGVNPTPLFLAAGWLCQGPAPQRPLDVLAVGVARSGFSAPLLPDLNWQAVVELNYSLRLNTNLTLQPVVQWILNPSADGRVPGIMTTGLQLTLNF